MMGLCASEKAMEAPTEKVHVKGLRDVYGYHRMDNPAKLSVMSWNTLSLSISSNSVTLQKKMDLKRKLQLYTVSLRRTPTLAIRLQWPYNSKVIW